jgi:hypothetical protein
MIKLKRIINKGKKMEVVIVLGAAWWAWNHFMS